VSSQIGKLSRRPTSVLKLISGNFVGKFLAADKNRLMWIRRPNIGLLRGLRNRVQASDTLRLRGQLETSSLGLQGLVSVLIQGQ